MDSVERGTEIEQNEQNDLRAVQDTQNVVVDTHRSSVDTVLLPVRGLKSLHHILRFNVTHVLPRYNAFQNVGEKR